MSPSVKQKRNKRHRVSASASGVGQPELFQNAPSIRSTDPDRPANIPMPPAEYIGGGSSTTSGSDRATSYSNLLAALDSDESYFPHPNEHVEDKDIYTLEPNWASQFDGPSVPPWIRDRIAAKEAEIPLKQASAPGSDPKGISSWMEGTMPTLWQKIPGAYTVAAPAPAPSACDMSMQQYDMFERKIDSKLEKMFKKLEDLENGKSESSHIEIILFILGGLFLLLMLDMLVKQGTKATMMIAAAGGGGFRALQGGFRMPF